MYNNQVTSNWLHGATKTIHFMQDTKRLQIIIILSTLTLSQRKAQQVDRLVYLIPVVSPPPILFLPKNLVFLLRATLHLLSITTKKLELDIANSFSKASCTALS